MNQSRAFLMSLIFAGLAMMLVYFYVSEKESTITSEFGTPITVIVAAKDINEFEEIQQSMLTTKVIPIKFAQPGAYNMIKSGTAEKISQYTVETFVGAVASAPIRKGEQVLLNKVLLKGSDTGLASQVAISRRALSIPANDLTGVTRLLKPGDRVDLISSIQYKGTGGQEAEVKTLLQNVHVLAVGEVIQNKIPQAFEQDPLSGSRKAINLRGSRQYNAVTIEVTPQDAQSVIWALQNGSEIFMTLRNPVDRVIASVPTTTVDEVLGPNSKKAEKERAKFLPPPKADNRPPTPPPAPPPPGFGTTGGGLFK